MLFHEKLRLKKNWELSVWIQQWLNFYFIADVLLFYLKHSTVRSYAFTDQGVAMFSAVLRSETAIRISIRIMDVFVAVRRFISKNAPKEITGYNVFVYFNSLRSLLSPSNTFICWMAIWLSLTNRSPCRMPCSMNTALRFSIFERQINSLIEA